MRSATMKTPLRLRTAFTLLLAAVIIAACGAPAPTAPPSSPTPPPTQAPASQGRCGDGVCDGPENQQNCPQDCATPPAPSAAPTQAPMQPTTPSRGPCGDGVCDGPENAQNCPQDCAAPQATAVSGPSSCPEPNPVRAVISEELVEWHNWLHDGSFEQGQTEIELADHSQAGLNRATAERSSEAARSGEFGYAIHAGPNEGLTFSVRTRIDKGEAVRFSFWARSLHGEFLLQPTIYYVERGQEDQPVRYTPDATFAVGSEWTLVRFEDQNTMILRHVLLSVEVGPNTTLHIDDVQIEQELWSMPEYGAESRNVGGIPVSDAPEAPTHLSFLIHIEDPGMILTNEAYFRARSAVFTELAKLLHQHGGFLTIQPEEQWVKASDRFAPGLLRELAEKYGVQYSTHTHGPHCRDDEGRLRSASDCRSNRDAPGWDQSVNDYDYPEVVEYVGNLQALISNAAGVPVTDHNGNWEFAEATHLAELGIQTWSAYKSWRTQRTYDLLINNPWRPGQVSADTQTEQWLTHDPGTQIVYIPGWTQTLTRFHERAQEKLAPILAQWLYHADPQRVNTFTVMLHVDIFQAREQEDDLAYLVHDDASDEMIYSEEFTAHLAHWDRLLSELIDPLVAEGYLQWTSLPEMGQLFRQWEEENCGAAAAPAAAETPQATPPERPTAQPAIGAPDAEPPINIFLVLHIDPEMDRETDTFQVTPAIYHRTRDQIDWLVEEASRHNLHFTALYNGWYPKEALALGDTSQFEELLAAGHEIGSHAHRLTYDAQQDLWVARIQELGRYGNPSYDAQLAEQTWDESHHHVQELLEAIGASGQNHTMCAVAFKCSDEGTLMDKFGFTIASGNRSEKGPAYFGHIVWNPWRAATSDTRGQELMEDRNAGYISLDHLAQVGIKGGAHGMDLSVPQLQRRFLMLYAEWLSRERLGAEDRVWTFGFVYHPEDGDVFNDALTELLSWLDANFVGRTSPRGNVIAQYATTGDIARQFEAWEAEHPAASSFHYTIDDPYPYSYEIVPQMLDGADYEGRVNLGDGVTCFRLSKGGQPIYWMWSDSGESTANLSSELLGQVRVTSADGQQSVHDASALSLTEEPLFVEPMP